MSFIPLSFGVEIELLLGHKAGTPPFPSWDNLAATLSRLLGRAGVRNHVAKRNVPETYREWCLMREVTIPDDPVRSLYGIELVSPVYDAGGNQWVADVETIFALLDAHNIQVYQSDKCSTHVHLSTYPHPLTETAAMHLAEAVLYYEAALDALMPAHRQTATAAGTASYWCQSNRASHLFAGIETAPPQIDNIEDYVLFCRAEHKAGRAVPLSNADHEIPLDTCLDIVRACHDMSAFSMDQAMNWMAAGSLYGRTRRMATDFVRGKVYKWNFESLYRRSSKTKTKTANAPHKDGTVEFRLPPGSVCATDVGLWVSLAATFVAGVLVLQGRQISSPAGNGATLGELKLLLEEGQQALGWQDLGLLQDVLKSVQ
ncbi:hypothetical protein SBRCBS47491_002098 [Sporothrix bragantina]|uniref:Amidoligase enzyme n=1 Tax=Sporothrix bragantina TaxID=671064 RepID=A0ABP0B414_9PEZI